MKREKHLQRLILLHVRDGKPPPELSSYSEQEIIYNGALLIQDGYVDGHVTLNASGIPVATSITMLFSKGHDFLDEIDPMHQPATSTQAATKANVSPKVHVTSKVPDDTKKLLEEAVGHLQVEHRQDLDDAIRNLRFKLANQGISRSGAANQQMVQAFCANFDAFTSRICIEATRILEPLPDKMGTEQDIIRILEAILDATAQGDLQCLLGLIEPSKLAFVTTTKFQEHCRQARAKLATEMKIFCRGVKGRRAEVAQPLISPDGSVASHVAGKEPFSGQCINPAFLAILRGSSMFLPPMFLPFPFQMAKSIQLLTRPKNEKR